MVALRKIFSFRIGIIIILVLGLCVGIYRYWGIPFFSAYRKYCWWVNQTDTLEKQLNGLQLQVAQKKHFIRKLMVDRDFREYVSHEQLKYLKDNEYVIFFKQNEGLK